MNKTLEYYSQPALMTLTNKYGKELGELPHDVGELMKIVQGLIIYEYTARDFYGFAIPKERLLESHLRPVEALLDRIFELNPEPLTVKRPPEKRLVGICHHFVLLMVALLRAKGIPARSRWGFGSYFNPGFYEDHITCEYWDAPAEQWKLADAQFDEIWREKLHIDHDVLDVPRDRFILTHDMWRRCRAGDIDDKKVGIFKGDHRGLWFVGGSLVRDAAALNKHEMLPWDVWGAIPQPKEQLKEEQLAFFDHLAGLERDPDTQFDAVRALYDDSRIRIPGTVFNAVLNKSERV